MGDRANLAIKQGSSDEMIFLYTHWHGEELPELLRQALNSREARRIWDDEPYLARVLISRVIQDHTGELGWGLSLGLSDDNQGVAIVVDTKDQTVEFKPIDREEWEIDEHSQGVKFTFDAYCSLDHADWPKYAEYITPREIET